MSTESAIYEEYRIVSAKSGNAGEIRSHELTPDNTGSFGMHPIRALECGGLWIRTE